MRRFIVAVTFVLASCAASEPAPPADVVSVERQELAADGRDIAEAQCAACHAIGAYGDSPVAEAPVFRTIFQRYSSGALEQELIEGIRVSHPMPEFHFNPQGTDALIAYLESIQEAPPPQ